MMLGALLIREGLVTARQLEDALSLQRQLGAIRLGAVLVELGYLEIDTLARALSAQQRVPAVLAKHVAAIDANIVAIFPARVASDLQAIPLGHTQTAPRRLIVALRDPLTTPLDEIAFIAGMRIDPGVAPELLIRRCLEGYYGLKQERRSIDLGIGATLGESPSWGPGESDATDARPPAAAAPRPRLEAPSIDPTQARLRTRSAPSLVLYPPAPPAPEVFEGQAEPPSSGAAGEARRAELAAIEQAIEEERVRIEPVLLGPTDEELPPDDGWDSVPVAIVAPPVHGAMTAPPGALRPVLGTDEALAALEASSTRDEIGDILATWLESTYGCGLVLIVKDGTALGWKGYAPDVESDLIESIAMPLGPPSMLTEAFERRQSFVGAPPADGMPLQTRLWKLLRCAIPSEVIVAPVVLGSRVVNLLYAHPEAGVPLPATAAEDITRVADRASAEYARLIRSRK